jgi:hypothetical protein
MKEIIDYLLAAPETQLDSRMKPMVEKWSDPPTALQVLEVVDHCINGSLASGFVVAMLQALYDIRCKEEKTSHDEVVKLATWRSRL